MWGQGDFKMQREYAGLLAERKEIEHDDHIWAAERRSMIARRMGELKFNMQQRGVTIPTEEK